MVIKNMSGPGKWMVPGLLISKVNFHLVGPLFFPMNAGQHTSNNYLNFFKFLVLISLFGFVDHKERKIQKLRKADEKPIGQVRIVIDKSDYLLRLYDEKGLFARYPVVFGAEPKLDKMVQGDRRTPEGSFSIVAIKKHKKWKMMMMLDYPNPEVLEKFERRKKKGLVEEAANPGNGIAIHGVWPNDDYLIDQFKNWTDGCISLKNEQLLDLARFVKVGTKVEIIK